MTLTEAAVQLGVSTRTLRRRIKEGSVYAAMEDGKYYLDITEVNRLSTLSNRADKDRVAMPRGVSRQITTPTHAITLDKAAYDNMVARISFLEGQQQILLDHKAGQEAMTKELTEARAKLAELKAEVERQAVLGAILLRPEVMDKAWRGSLSFSSPT